MHIIPSFTQVLVTLCDITAETLDVGIQFQAEFRVMVPNLAQFLEWKTTRKSRSFGWTTLV